MSPPLKHFKCCLRLVHRHHMTCIVDLEEYQWSILLLNTFLLTIYCERNRWCSLKAFLPRPFYCMHPIWVPCPFQETIVYSTLFRFISVIKSVLKPLSEAQKRVERCASLNVHFSVVIKVVRHTFPRQWASSEEATLIDISLCHSCLLVLSLD